MQTQLFESIDYIYLVKAINVCTNTLNTLSSAYKYQLLCKIFGNIIYSIFYVGTLSNNALKVFAINSKQ